MKTTRKRYSADFKSKVALEALRGDLTLAALGGKHGIHHTMIAAWKRPRDRRDGLDLCWRLGGGAGERRGGDRQASFQDRAVGCGTGTRIKSGTSFLAKACRR